MATGKCFICTSKYDYIANEGGLCNDCREELKEIHKEYPEDVHRGCKSALRGIVGAGLREARRIAVGCEKPDQMMMSLRKTGMLL